MIGANMSRETKETIGAFSLVGLFLLGVILLFAWSLNQTDKHCKEQFGEGWDAKYEHYGADFCVNNDGEVKYPK